MESVKHFPKKAIESRSTPEKVTLDGYVTSHTVAYELKETLNLAVNVCVCPSKCLNDMIEQDHERIKQPVKVTEYELQLFVRIQTLRKQWHYC